MKKIEDATYKFLFLIFALFALGGTSAIFYSFYVNTFDKWVFLFYGIIFSFPIFVIGFKEKFFMKSLENMTGVREGELKPKTVVTAHILMFVIPFVFFQCFFTWYQQQQINELKVKVEQLTSQR